MINSFTLTGVALLAATLYQVLAAVVVYTWHAAVRVCEGELCRVVAPP